MEIKIILLRGNDRTQKARKEGVCISNMKQEKESKILRLKKEKKFCYLVVNSNIQKACLSICLSINLSFIYLS